MKVTLLHFIYIVTNFLCSTHVMVYLDRVTVV